MDSTGKKPVGDRKMCGDHKVFLWNCGQARGFPKLFRKCIRSSTPSFWLLPSRFSRKVCDPLCVEKREPATPVLCFLCHLSLQIKYKRVAPSRYQQPCSQGEVVSFHVHKLLWQYLERKVNT